MKAAGPLCRTLGFGFIASLYAIGAPRRLLERLYESLCGPRLPHDSQ